MMISLESDLTDDGDEDATTTCIEDNRGRQGKKYQGITAEEEAGNKMAQPRTTDEQVKRSKT